jgi:hypothetical protein
VCRYKEEIGFTKLLRTMQKLSFTAGGIWVEMTEKYILAICSAIVVAGPCLHVFSE